MVQLGFEKTPHSYHSCCDIRYDFRIKTMFGSFLPPVVCRRAHVFFFLFFNVICVCLRIVVCNAYCICYCFFLSSSCLPYIASLPWLSILYCPFGILQRLFPEPHRCMIAWSVVYRGVEHPVWSNLWIGIGICCFPAKHAALRNKRKRLADPESD